jgi:hypothetical protein
MAKNSRQRVDTRKPKSLANIALHPMAAVFGAPSGRG